MRIQIFKTTFSKEKKESSMSRAPEFSFKKKSR